MKLARATAHEREPAALDRVVRLQGIEIGKAVSFNYPVPATILYRYAERPLNVTPLSVRDLFESPLTLDEFQTDLLYPWSRYVVECINHENGDTIRICLGTTREHRCPSVTRIGLYETRNARPIRLIGRQFEPTSWDRRTMVKIWKRERAKWEGDGCTLMGMVLDTCLRT